MASKNIFIELLFTTTTRLGMYHNEVIFIYVSYLLSQAF